MLRERMQATVAATKSTIDPSSGALRPYLSLSGPKTSCPAASPAMLSVRLSCTSDAGASNQSASAGSAGR